MGEIGTSLDDGEELLNERVASVDLHNVLLIATEVALVAKGLCLHDTLHIGRVTIPKPKGLFEGTTKDIARNPEPGTLTRTLEVKDALGSDNGRGCLGEAN